MSPLVRAAMVAAALAGSFSAAVAGRPPGQDIGRCIAAVGDVNGDGVTDLLVGSCGETAMGEDEPMAAAALLFSGKDGKLLRRLRASAVDWRGTTVAGAGDLNQDGIPDVVVGTPAAEAAGQVEAFSGADGSLLWVIRGADSGTIGTSVAAAGDVNGDESPDVVVGGYGFARVLSGKDGTMLFEWKGPKAKLVDGFGSAVAGGADVDRDGRPDIVVGAPFPGVGSIHAPPRGPGEVTVFSGRDGHVLLTVKGEVGGQAFGSAVAFLPGQDPGAPPDLLVGSRKCSLGGRGFAGRVYVISCRDGSVLRVIDGPDAGEALGTSVAAAGDINGDGVRDILAGAPDPGSDWATGTESTERGGRARVFSGKTGKLLLTLRPPKELDPYRFAEGVVGLPDVSGDKIPDLLVGAPECGAVLYSGATGEVLRILR